MSFQPPDDNANPRISSRSRSSDEPHIGKYRLIKTIGKGNFAKVKLAKHVPTGREVIQFLCHTIKSISRVCGYVFIKNKEVVDKGILSYCR